MLFSKKKNDWGEMDDALKTSASLRPSVHVKVLRTQKTDTIHSVISISFKNNSAETEVMYKYKNKTQRARLI